MRRTRALLGERNSCLLHLIKIYNGNYLANHEKDDWIDGEKTEDIVAYLDRLYTAKRKVEKRIAVLGGVDDSVSYAVTVKIPQPELSSLSHLASLCIPRFQFHFDDALAPHSARRVDQSELAVVFYGVHGSSEPFDISAVLAHRRKFQEPSGVGRLF